MIWRNKSKCLREVSKDKQEGRTAFLWVPQGREHSQGILHEVVSSSQPNSSKRRTILFPKHQLPPVTSLLLLSEARSPSQEKVHTLQPCLQNPPQSLHPNWSPFTPNTNLSSLANLLTVSDSPCCFQHILQPTTYHSKSHFCLPWSLSQPL